MKNPLIVANWKMGVPMDRVDGVINTFIAHTTPEQREHVIICPTFAALPRVIAHKQDFFVGAQDCSSEPSGARTGDVPVSDLITLGCSAVIVGHSERRQYHGETNDVVAKKVAQAITAGLIPILCIGESKEERAGGSTSVVLQQQLEQGLSLAQGIKDFMIAYEPVWAIGASQPATVEVIQEVHAMVAKWYPHSRILYGGAVDDKTITTICSLPHVDGVLVGRASWNAETLAVLLERISTL